MKFYPKQIDKMAAEIVQTLVDNNDIEVEPDSIPDAREDFAAIMREYQRQADQIADDAKTTLIRRNWPSSKFNEARKIVASSKNFPLGDEGIDFVINQMLEFMLITKNIEEVYAEDHTLRKIIVTILRRYAQVDDEVDREARARLKHLEEGTRDWEIQYQRARDQVRRNKGLV